MKTLQPCNAVEYAPMYLCKCRRLSKTLQGHARSLLVQSLQLLVLSNGVQMLNGIGRLLCMVVLFNTRTNVCSADCGAHSFLMLFTLHNLLKRFANSLQQIHTADSAVECRGVPSLTTSRFSPLSLEECLPEKLVLLGVLVFLHPSCHNSYMRLNDTRPVSAPPLGANECLYCECMLVPRTKTCLVGTWHSLANLRLLLLSSLRLGSQQARLSSCCC